MYLSYTRFFIGYWILKRGWISIRPLILNKITVLINLNYRKCIFYNFKFQYSAVQIKKEMTFLSFPFNQNSIQ